MLSLNARVSITASIVLTSFFGLAGTALDNNYRSNTTSNLQQQLLNNIVTLIAATELDEQGNVCPLAMDMLEFQVEGAARFMGVANGNQMGHDSFTDSTHPLFYGKAVAVLRSDPGSSGSATLLVKSASGPEASTEIYFTDQQSTVY